MLPPLRQTLSQHALAALILPTADPHLSEYIPEHWQSRQYFSGFTGSAGVLVVQPDSAELWTDSRYWTQAEAELAGSGISLQKQENGRNHITHLAQTLPENAAVGIAPDMLSISEFRRIQAAFAPKNIALKYDLDYTAAAWGNARPALPAAPVFAQKAEFVPQSATEKLHRVRQAMHQAGADWHFISALDDIAWLTNLRGSDIAYNPVFLSHLLIGADGTATLFVVPSKISPDIQAALNAAAIQIQPYEHAADALEQLSGCLMYDPAKVAVSTVFRLPPSVAKCEQANPSTQFKAEKCAAEVANIRQAMLQDGIALCGFFAELEQRLAQGEPITEYQIGEMLLAHRSQRDHFVSESFGTIAGYNANGALPHYAATPEAFSDITGSGLLLIDSGAQYLGGTTDITRVVPVGETTPEQKRDYTLVLKAHIALAETVFPENIAAPLLDAICRKPLWQEQCNYGHGTGHGVGYFLNVHEGPQIISYLTPANPNQTMKAGMITSNEPGLYRPGKWGIRIENLVASLPVASPQETEFGKFLHFETLTLCPIDTRPIDFGLLTKAEVRWLNAYHADVREKLLPLVDGEARDWLLLRTEAV